MKAQASKHPIFSRICVNLGQTMHYIATRINVVSSGYKFIGVKPLDQETALKDGARHLFSYSTTCLIIPIITIIICLFIYLYLPYIITTGVGYFAEGILFGSAGLIIIIEYYRSEAKSLKSKLKQEEKEEKERKELEDRFQMIETKIEALLKQNEERLKNLNRIGEEQRRWWKWFS